MSSYTFALLFLFCAFGGALAGSVSFQTCTSDGTFTLDYIDISGCSGAGPCVLYGDQTYTVGFTGCTNNRANQVITDIPYSIDPYFLLEVLSPPFDHGDLCDHFASNSSTTLCPATIPSNGVACGTWTLSVNIPCYLNLPPIIGLPITVKAAAWANVKSGTPVMCVTLPATYYIC